MGEAPAGKWRIVTASFVAPVAFGGLMISNATIGRPPCQSITPCILGPDGVPIPTDKGQRADGLMIRGHARLSQGVLDRMAFVTMANVSDIDYEWAKS